MDMRALVFENSMPRQAATKLLSTLTPCAFVSAMEWYFELLQTKRLDLTPIITHRFPLAAYREAFLTCSDQGRNEAVKVLFEFPDSSAHGSPPTAGRTGTA